MRFKHKLAFFCIGVLVLLSACRTFEGGRLSCPVNISHPGINKGKPFEYSLVKVSNEDGSPLEYYIDVDSVACGENVCDIVKVRIYWNALGEYLRMDFPQGGKLTKKDHVAFTPADYEKLNQILSDPDSALKKFSPSGLSSGEDGSDVDAVTKPTPLFYQTAVVRGAIYTCYTLWHWVNGNVQGIIRDMTEESCTREHLVRYINEGDISFFAFALHVLVERGIYDDEIVSAIMARSNKERAVFMQSAIEYFESSAINGHNELYFKAIVGFFAESNSQKRILCLRSLGEIGLNGTGEFYNKLAGFLPDLKSYFEVHLLLTIFEKHNPDSNAIVTEVEKVLKNENFLIARRAYWFLEKRDLNKTQSAEVEAFRIKYEDRL